MMSKKMIKIICQNCLFPFFMCNFVSKWCRNGFERDTDSKTAVWNNW